MYGRLQYKNCVGFGADASGKTAGRTRRIFELFFEVRLSASLLIVEVMTELPMLNLLRRSLEGVGAIAAGGGAAAHGAGPGTGWFLSAECEDGYR